MIAWYVIFSLNDEAKGSRQLQKCQSAVDPGNAEGAQGDSPNQARHDE